MRLQQATQSSRSASKMSRKSGIDMEDEALPRSGQSDGETNIATPGLSRIKHWRNRAPYLSTDDSPLSCTGATQTPTHGHTWPASNVKHATAVVTSRRAKKLPQRTPCSQIQSNQQRGSSSKGAPCHRVSLSSITTRKEPQHHLVTDPRRGTPQ